MTVGQKVVCSVSYLRVPPRKRESTTVLMNVQAWGREALEMQRAIYHTATNDEACNHISAASLACIQVWRRKWRGGTLRNTSTSAGWQAVLDLQGAWQSSDAGGGEGKLNQGRRNSPQRRQHNCARGSPIHFHSALRLARTVPRQ